MYEVSCGEKDALTQNAEMTLQASLFDVREQ